MQLRVITFTLLTVFFRTNWDPKEAENVTITSPSLYADHFELQVPSARVTSPAGSDVILPCCLSPVMSAISMQIRWCRKDCSEYVFLHMPRKIGEGRGYEGRVSLFSLELEKGNVSLLLRDVGETDAGEYRCQVKSSSWTAEGSKIQLVLQNKDPDKVLEQTTQPQPVSEGSDQGDIQHPAPTETQTPVPPLAEDSEKASPHHPEEKSFHFYHMSAYFHLKGVLVATGICIALYLLWRLLRALGIRVCVLLALMCSAVLLYNPPHSLCWLWNTWWTTGKTEWNEIRNRLQSSLPNFISHEEVCWTCAEAAFFCFITYCFSSSRLKGLFLAVVTTAGFYMAEDRVPLVHAWESAEEKQKWRIVLGTVGTLGFFCLWYILHIYKETTGMQREQQRTEVKQGEREVLLRRAEEELEKQRDALEKEREALEQEKLIIQQEKKDTEAHQINNKAGLLQPDNEVDTQGKKEERKERERQKEELKKVKDYLHREILSVENKRHDLQLQIAEVEKKDKELQQKRNDLQRGEEELQKQQSDLEKRRLEVERQKNEIKKHMINTPMQDKRRDTVEGEGFAQITSYEVDVVLDRSTAHCKLCVSPDGKSVQWVEEGVQNPPSDPSRFDTEPFVLGNMGLCWRSYWEVCVEEKEDWLLGVALDTADRKGQLQLSPSKGFWVIRQSNGRTLKAMNEQLEVVKDKPIPSTVGVYLDYKEQEVSFYNAVDGSLIYTFTNGPSYANRVRPLFSPWNNDPDPLKVLSI